MIGIEKIRLKKSDLAAREVFSSITWRFEDCGFLRNLGGVLSDPAAGRRFFENFRKFSKIIDFQIAMFGVQIGLNDI